MANSEEEVWRAHPDIAGIEVSTLGNVRTLDRLVSSENGTRFLKGRVLKQFDNGKGYLKVNIWNGGKQIVRAVHRLVAQTFIPNPDNLPQVNHLDCIRTNNNVDNLEWCDNSYNAWYREKYGKTKSKPVLAFNLATFKVSQFPSQKEAGQAIGVNAVSINNVIKGRIKQTCGFWFTNDDEKAADTIKQKLYEIKHQSTLKMQKEVRLMQKHANEDIRYMSYRIPNRLIANKLGITTQSYSNMLVKPLKKEKHDQIVGIIKEIKEEIENGIIG